MARLRVHSTHELSKLYFWPTQSHQHVSFVLIALIKQTFICEAPRSCNAPSLVSVSRAYASAGAARRAPPHDDPGVRTLQDRAAPDGH